MNFEGYTYINLPKHVFTSLDKPNKNKFVWLLPTEIKTFSLKFGKLQQKYEHEAYIIDLAEVSQHFAGIILRPYYNTITQTNKDPTLFTREETYTFLLYDLFDGESCCIWDTSIIMDYIDL